MGTMVRNPCDTRRGEYRVGKQTYPQRIDWLYLVGTNGKIEIFKVT